MTLSSGYCRSQEWPVRDIIRTFPSSMKQMARTPSHLTSKSHSSPLGGFSVSEDFMGTMVAGMGARTAPGREEGSTELRTSVLAPTSCGEIFFLPAAFCVNRDGMSLAI